MVHGLRVDGAQDSFYDADLSIGYDAGINLHTRGSDCDFPVHCETPMMPLVSMKSTRLSADDSRNMQYFYGDFRVHKQGHGALGMSGFETLDIETGRRNISYRDTDSPNVPRRFHLRDVRSMP